MSALMVGKKMLSVVVPPEIHQRIRAATDRTGGGPISPTIRRLLMRGLEIEERKREQRLAKADAPEAG